MNTDACFQIGKDHIICEDYALSGKINDISYAIVCDGCSASPDVDFGARILASSARELIHSFPLSEEEIKRYMCDKDPSYDKATHFGNEVIYLAEEVISKFKHLNELCLDATLLIAFIKDYTSHKDLSIYMFGDGMFIHKSKDYVKMYHAKLTSGAPDYLSYHLDDSRMDNYKKLKDNHKEVDIITNGNLEKKIYNPFHPVVYHGAIEEGDVVSVISDGINSFRKQDNEEIDWNNLVDEFTGFKNFEGQFVLRRISAFKRKCMKENWHHLDDISIASIVV